MVARETVGRESAKSCSNLDKRQWELEVGYYFSNQFERYYGGRIFRAGQLIRWWGGMNGALRSLCECWECIKVSVCLIF